MKLKGIRPLLAGKVILYEEAAEKNVYNDIFTGECRDIPKGMLEKEIVVISASTKGDVLDIELKSQ